MVVVYTLAGEVLLMSRTRPAGFWQSVTGSLEWQESPRQAAERELFEETGLHPSGALYNLHHCERFPIIYPWRARYAPSAHYNREHWFAIALQGRRTIRRNPVEHSQARWFPFSEAATRATSWTNRKAISLIMPGQFGVRVKTR